MRVSEEVDVGDIQIIPGHRLRGRVTLSDGARDHFSRPRLGQPDCRHRP
jgi:hypothetical protein